MALRIVTVIGARPQFIKAAPVSKALKKMGCPEILVHTGQHYDYEMSRIFFDELGIPEPNFNLEVGSGSHGYQTGEILMRIEKILLDQKPDWVLVYGDTNSTLAGALAAVKLHIPVAHVEAGLRSFNREMPEEHNRVLTDHCADLLFCPTQTAVDNLARESLTRNVYMIGDTMYDAVLLFTQTTLSRAQILQKLDLETKGYLLATIHRPYNTDDSASLRGILEAFLDIDEPVIFPVHPRTQSKIHEFESDLLRALQESQVKLISPVGYFDMLVLEQNARLILTDSGGVQKEAFFFGVPCITLRPETEWIETVQLGWNKLVGADHRQIVNVVKKQQWPVDVPPAIFGDGHASERIVTILTEK